MTFRRQLRSEWRKWSTVRSSWALVVATVLADVLLKVISALLADPGRATAAETLFALRPSIFAPVLLCALGALPAVAEWRYRTAGPTYCVQPRRDVVLAAKVAVAAAVGLAAGGLATGLSDAAVLLVARQRDLPLPGPGTVAAAAAGAVAAAVVLAAAGAAVGSILTSPVAALGVPAVVFLVLGPVALLIDPRLYALLPGGLLDSLAGQRAANPDLLAPWLAAAGTAAGTAAVVALAVRVVRRRSLT